MHGNLAGRAADLAGMQGSAKAWASYNGSGTTLPYSLNMTSATDNGTGNYTFTIANDMDNANYAASSIIHPATSTSGMHMRQIAVADI